MGHNAIVWSLIESKMNQLGRKFLIIFFVCFSFFIGVYLIYDTSDISLLSPHELLKNWSYAVKLSASVKTSLPSSSRLSKSNISFIETVPHNNFTFVLSTTRQCTKPLKLLVVVPSSAENFEQRLAIRQTWGSVSVTTSVIKVIFFLAMPLKPSIQEAVENEQLVYDDIVQINLQESYRNLTLKIIMMLKWVSLHGSCSSLVLKADDDVFVNIPILLSLSDQFLNSENNVSLFGTLVKAGSLPVRSKSSKFYVSKNEYPLSTFPAYLGGPAYLILGPAIPFLYAATTKIKPIAMEDIYITGLCTELMGLQIKNEPVIDTIPHRPLKPCRLCDYAIAHQITASEMYTIFSKILSNCNCPFHSLAHKH